MTTLSLAAQAVLDAANNVNSYGPDDCLNESREIVAAALRAVADQVAPYETELIDNCHYEARNPVREQLLAIATELETA